MQSFGIFAHGETFEPETFLAKHPIPNAHLWKRGEPKSHSCIGTPHTTSGVSFEIPGGQDAAFPQQPRIAQAFIAANREALRSLARAPGVTYFTLGLHYPLHLAENTVAFSLTAPPELMRDLADLGCKLTTYVTIDRSAPGPA